MPPLAVQLVIFAAIDGNYNKRRKASPLHTHILCTIYRHLPHTGTSTARLVCVDCKYFQNKLIFLTLACQIGNTYFGLSAYLTPSLTHVCIFSTVYIVILFSANICFIYNINKYWLYLIIIM